MKKSDATYHRLPGSTAQHHSVVDAYCCVLFVEQSPPGYIQLVGWWLTSSSPLHKRFSRSSKATEVARLSGVECNDPGDGLHMLLSKTRSRMKYWTLDTRYGVQQYSTLHSVQQYSTQHHCSTAACSTAVCGAVLPGSSNRIDTNQKTEPAWVSISMLLWFSCCWLAPVLLCAVHGGLSRCVLGVRVSGCVQQCAVCSPPVPGSPT